MAVIPQRYIFSTKNASAERNTEPILLRLLTLSKIRISGVFVASLKPTTVLRLSSSFFNLRITF